jgi:hypothetical protein
MRALDSQHVLHGGYECAVGLRRNDPLLFGAIDDVQFHDLVPNNRNVQRARPLGTQNKPERSAWLPSRHRKSGERYARRVACGSERPRQELPTVQPSSYFTILVLGTTPATGDLVAAGSAVLGAYLGSLGLSLTAIFFIAPYAPGESCVAATAEAAPPPTRPPALLWRVGGYGNEFGARTDREHGVKVDCGVNPRARLR